MSTEIAFACVVLIAFAVQQFQLASAKTQARERMFIMLECLQQLSILLETSNARNERLRRLPEDRPVASLDKEFNELKQSIKAAHEYNKSNSTGGR